MDSTLSVKITADIGDLQDKFAAAKEETSQLGDGLNALSRQAEAGAISSGLIPQLKDTAAAAKEAADIWKEAVNQIGTAESSLVKDVLEKRKGLSRDMLQIVERLAETEIADDVKMWTAKILNATVAQGKIAAIEKGGVLYRATASLFGEGTSDASAGVTQQGAGGLVKAASQASGDAQGAAQTAALTSNSAALTALTAALTGHGTVPATNTAAQSAGAVATTTNTAATATGSVATATHTVATTGNAVATSTNTAVQSTNLAATVANTIATLANTIALDIEDAIEAVGDLLGFDTGADNIPNDMVARVHKGEMIIPAHRAAEIRASGGLAGWELKDASRYRSSALSVGSFQAMKYAGGRGGDTNFHNHYYPTINMREPADLKRLLGTSGAEFADSIQRGYRVGSPTRPSGRTV
ncbi:MAG: hypothetical protein ABSD74_05610 [Rhizomicrobium sp.]|jgi:hypothetical protein